MTHISVASPKGGAGKTNTALNLAAAFAHAGHRVCLVDRDPQGGAMIFGKVAERAGIVLPFVPTTARVSGFDLYIHDHPPGLEDHYPSSLIVMPTMLDAPSVLVHRRGREHFKNLGLKVLPVAMAYRQGRAEQDRLMASEFKQDPVIRFRALYPTLYGMGLTAVDATNIRYYSAGYLEDAKKEIEALRLAVQGALP